MKKLVSIVIPVYNAGDFIIQTLDSVLHQTYSEWELLLVLDGCSDNSQEIIEEYQRSNKEKRIRILKQPENRGAAEARNRGVREANGRFIAYLDSDDLWRKDKLEKQVAFMEETGGGFSFTGYEFADEEGKPLGKIVKVPPTLTYKEALKNTTIFTTTVMFDTLKIEKDTLVMPSIRSEDTALWWKVLGNGHTAYGLNENLALYRRAGKTLSSNKFKAIVRIWNLYRKEEQLSILKSVYYFCFWAIRAVKRRV